MKDRDSLQRFTFENLAVRGEIAHLDAAWQAVLERRDYPPVVRRLLGEAMVATALLSATIKFEGLLSLQIQSQGPLAMLVVQCTSEGGLRGLARWRDRPPEGSLQELCGGGTLAITVDQQGRELYQGVVDIVGASLAAALEQYFERSEQLPTRLQLVATERIAAGLLLQRLPQESADPDAWNRIELLGSTLTESELLRLTARDIVRRLFNEEDVRLFESQTMSFRCTCSRDRTATMLRSLGHEEVKSILAEEGNVSVECQFCGISYVFDPVDAEGLFALTVQPDKPTTRH